ncbi:hypothetical protein JW911_05145 [Candidatus Peregrinibacteria bacterium]|nr:hypothetical protein [Candidatus Peregrinibacteria bacterium]
MNKTDVSQNILDKIKKEHIKPVPKWHFMLKKSVIWGLFAVSLILGSFAFSLILLHINEVEWDIYEQAAGSMWGFVLMVIPYFWIVFIMGFIFLAYYNFRHTETGYRYNTFYIVLISIGASILIGTGLFAFGVSEGLEDAFSENVPYYKDLNFGRHKIWVMEERGLIGGKIIKVRAVDDFDLKDFQGKMWIIRVEEKPDPTFPRLNKLKSVIIPKPGLTVKVIGVKENDNVFKAFEIRPWKRVERFIRIKF